jgi:uncharacterized protein YkwD
VKKRIARAILSAAFAVLLCAGGAYPAKAVNNPFAAMEERSRQVVAAAISAGVIPADATMFDCKFRTGEDGITRVIQYKGEDGVWIDVSAGQPANTRKPGRSEPLTEDVLAGYADEIFRLTNAEREKEGLEPLERDADLENAAAIRAEEMSREFSHTRPDGAGFHTVLDSGENHNYAENGGYGRTDPEDQIGHWMDSDGHRANILDRKGYGYTSIGIGVYQAENGKLYMCQLFYHP